MLRLLPNVVIRFIVVIPVYIPAKYVEELERSMAGTQVTSPNHVYSHLDTLQFIKDHIYYYEDSFSWIYLFGTKTARASQE